MSGDDVGSDIDEDDEILAEEEAGLFGYEEDGDQSDVPLSEHELWDQVNKAHMKETLADDKADLRDIKERFLKGEGRIIILYIRVSVNPGVFLLYLGLSHRIDWFIHYEYSGFSKLDVSDMSNS